MKVVCAPIDATFDAAHAADLEVVLFSHPDREDRGAAGASIVRAVERAKLRPDPRAWDLLSVALAIIAADTGVERGTSPDGWTRVIDLRIAVSDPASWAAQRPLLERMLRFLTTDLWSISFLDGGLLPEPPSELFRPDEDCVSLLSGGLDSLIGAVDLVQKRARSPYLVSQVALGDKARQATFASQIRNGSKHLQLNHVVSCPGRNERSQRARSIVFLAYGVLVATTLARYDAGDEVQLFVCENGFISINPPLTLGRLGSLSTRTAHPAFLSDVQSLLDALGLRVRIINPYAHFTKGEMLTGCADQPFLKAHAHTSTSCGRFARMGYEHCGRCVPCLIRRASFHAWGEDDRTSYKYSDLSRDDTDHAGFDDVRSAAMAVTEVRNHGLDRWLGTSLTSELIDDPGAYRDVVARGLDELGHFLDAAGVV